MLVILMRPRPLPPGPAMPLGPAAQLRPATPLQRGNNWAPDAVYYQYGEHHG